MNLNLKKNKICSFLILLLLLSGGCYTANQISLFNLSYLYKPESTFTQLDALVYHSQDTLSTLFINVRLSDLLYVKPVNGQGLEARYMIHYQLLNNYESRQILDSASANYKDSLNYRKNAQMLVTYDIPAKYPNDYVVEVELTDLNRNSSLKTFVPVWKSSRLVAQNFRIMDRDGKLLFRNYLKNEEQARIVVNDIRCDTLTVRCYFRDFPVARPPFAEGKEESFKYDADSVFTILLSNGVSDWITLEKKGFYFFQKDPAVREGLTMYKYDDEFPEIKTAEQLVYPLRYITTHKEYDSLITAPDPKEAADAFWLKTAENPLRAKTLIQKYYTGVEEANRFFTSYAEGWKTDRGLIYIIFGKPNYVYRGIGQEEWVYGEPNHRNSLRFTFVQVRNPFTNNDYMLLRSPTMKDAWYIAVQSWRR